MLVYRIFIGVATFVVALCAFTTESAYAQTETAADTTAAVQDNNAAQVEEVAGDQREVTLTEAITAEPARPLIQFTHNRPRVSFREVRVGPSSRTFFSELRKGSQMEVGSPVIDILVLFPGIIP